MYHAWQGDTCKVKEAIPCFLSNNFAKNLADAGFAHEDNNSVPLIPESKTQQGFNHPIYAKFLLPLNKQDEFKNDPELVFICELINDLRSVASFSLMWMLAQQLVVMLIQLMNSLGLCTLVTTHYPFAKACICSKWAPACDLFALTFVLGIQGDFPWLIKELLLWEEDPCACQGAPWSCMNLTGTCHLYLLPG